MFLLEFLVFEAHEIPLWLGSRWSNSWESAEEFPVQAAGGRLAGGRRRTGDQHRNLAMPQFYEKVLAALSGSQKGKQTKSQPCMFRVGEWIYVLMNQVGSSQ